MKCKVNWTLEHNGKTYEAGSTVNLSAEAFEALGGSEVVTPAETAAPAPAPEQPAPEQPEQPAQ